MNASICALFPTFFISVLTIVSASAAQAQTVAPPVPISLERIHADPPLAGRAPTAPRLSPGGGYVGYLQGSAADSDVQELWVRPLPQGEPRRLASTADLLGDSPATLTEAEKMALERRRILKRGITSFQWCGQSDQRVVVPLGGALFVVDVAPAAAPAGTAARPRVQRLDFPPGDPAREPQCDRAGTQIAYVQRNDLWVQPLAGEPGAAPRRLTSTGSATLSTGLAEFIAAEEFDRYDGFWWSRDGRMLLAMEVDESPVPVKSRMQIRAQGSDIVRQRYPAAGEPNARVQALVVDVTSGAVRRLPLPSGAEYLVRAGWFADGTPWLQWMPRDQTALHLVEFPPAPAEPHPLLVEQDPAWVEVHDDLIELEAQPLSGRSSLLWSSERTGRRQLWQVDRVTGAQRRLTNVPEPVAAAVCSGASGTVFAVMRDNGMTQELMLQEPSGNVRPLEAGPVQQRVRSARGDRDCKRLLVTESSWQHPPHTQVQAVDGSMTPLALVGAEPEPLLAQVTPQVQALRFLAADGKTALNGLYMPPLPAPSAASSGSFSGAGRKRPVIVSAYGGPGVLDVSWRYNAQMPLYAHWQRLGFGVLLVGTRGMLGRDRDFTRAHYHAFAKVEVDDLFAAVRQLPSKVSGIDPARIGFTGWSYGGFLAVRAMLDEATPFAAAVAGAPVVDSRLYDTAYTERYLGLPSGDTEVFYEQADLTRRAAKLSRPLMLMHGTADDNVLFENTLKLTNALQAEGRLFETVIFPGQTHGLSSKALRLYRDRAQTDFFVRHLHP